jgi:hypothetical protein
VSIDFYIATPTHFYVTNLNMANSNAADLLKWIGLDASLWSGERFKASVIAPLCRRRLWDEKRNYDEEIPGMEDDRVIYCGRKAGYLREKTEHLLKVCEMAIDLDPAAEIYWG